MKEYIWIDWPNLDYESMPYRQSYRASVGLYEYPVDRFNLTNGRLELPHRNIVEKPEFNLYNLTNDWRDRYFSVMHEIADSVFKTANGRTVNLFYSGGIDSTSVLVALTRHPNFSNFLEQGKFKISLTSQSINEYPRMFYEEILPRIPIQPLDYNQSMLSNDLIVTGDLGDFIIGNSDASYYPNLDLMDSYHEIFKAMVTKERYKVYQPYHDMCNTCLGHAPFEIESCNQYLWWVNQCFVYQIDLVRPYIWSSTEDFSEIGTNNKVFRFFYDKKMTTFSYEYMSTNPQYSKADELRKLPKDFILNYTRDADYINKPKVYSQRLTFRSVYKSSIFIEDGIFKSEYNKRTITNASY